MTNVLIKEKRYRGQYVAIKDFKKPTVIAHGTDPKEVYKQAIKKGYTEPVIMQVPAKKMVQIYPHLQ